jgi:type II secretory pathway pseudopilin PulG
LPLPVRGNFWGCLSHQIFPGATQAADRGKNFRSLKKVEIAGQKRRISCCGAEIVLSSTVHSPREWFRTGTDKKMPAIFHSISRRPPLRTFFHMRCGRHIRRAAFSLLELLAVAAVVALLASLLLPAVSGFFGTAGRRGAVNILMGAFEQARIAAIGGGRPVHVVLHRRMHPEPDAVIVVRETEDGTGAFERLSPWMRLPKGVLLHDPGADNILSQPAVDAAFAGRIAPAPRMASGEKLNVVTFNASGGVEYPAGGEPNRQLYLSEGVRGPGGSEEVIGALKKSSGTGFEVISLSRYTGRAQFDVTSTGG